jgi:hypothetical protein
MLTLANFLTIGGATGITVAVVSVIHALWPQGSEAWATWSVAEIVVFLGGLLSESLTVAHGVLLFVSGMVVAAAALGSRTGVQMVRTPTSRGTS